VRGTGNAISAPGDKVGGASIDGDHAYSVWSGTSMSVPHVAGAVAIFARGDASVHPREIKRRILEAATNRRCVPACPGHP
jgi:subtilisin family serine protease